MTGISEIIILVSCYGVITLKVRAVQMAVNLKGIPVKPMMIGTYGLSLVLMSIHCRRSQGSLISSSQFQRSISFTITQTQKRRMTFRLNKITLWVCSLENPFSSPEDVKSTNRQLTTPVKAHSKSSTMCSKYLKMPLSLHSQICSLCN